MNAAKGRIRRILFDRLYDIADVFLDAYCDWLCLDCMDRSDPLTGDSDKDYWQHNDLKEGDWIERCRIHHKQPTWYYSFMGRDETRNKYKELKKKSADVNRVRVWLPLRVVPLSPQTSYNISIPRTRSLGRF